MRQIQYLILKEWFRFFLLAVAILLVLLTVANLISGLMRGNVSAVDVILNHLISLPNHSAKIFPIGCLIASLFSINKLKSRNELTAIFASGFDRKSFFLLLFYASLAVAALQFVTLGFIEPYTKRYRGQLILDSDKKFRNLKGKGLYTSTIGSGKIWYRTDEYFFSFRSFDKRSLTIRGLSAYFFRDHRLNQIITAEQASYKSHNYWTFRNGEVVSLLDSNNFPMHSKFEEMDFALNESPLNFKQIEADITTLNFFNLISYIENLDDSGISTSEYMMLLLGKVSTSLTCIVFALIAGLGAFNPNRRNSSFGKNISIVFAFTMCFWLVNSYFLEMGTSGNLSPYIASFIIPVFFSVIVAFIMYQRRGLK
ncbi:MAG: LptF/LptG family permease [Bacteriovoracaceae bacterium]